jgi:hypothetical protein
MGTHLRIAKVSYQVPRIQNEAPYQRRYHRRATRGRITRRSREGRNEVPAVNQSPTKKYGLEQKVQTCTQTFRTDLALEKSGSCEKSQEAIGSLLASRFSLPASLRFNFKKARRPKPGGAPVGAPGELRSARRSALQRPAALDGGRRARRQKPGAKKKKRGGALKKKSPSYIYMQPVLKYLYVTSCSELLAELPASCLCAASPRQL